MFEWMNRHKKDIMKYTMYLVIPSFIVLYGYGECAKPRSQRWVVRVNGALVTDVQWQNITENISRDMRQRMGPDAEISRSEIRQQAMESAINSKLFEQKAKECGITTTNPEVDRAIRQMQVPAFRDKAGNFSPELYRSVLYANRISPIEYEESIRENLTRTKLGSLVRSSIYRAAGDNQRTDQRSNSKIRVELLAFEPSGYVDDVSPTPEQVAAYFKEHQEDYRISEQRRIDYARFYPAAFTHVVSVTDTQLQSFFDRNQEKFEVPEKVVIQYIPYRADDFVKYATASEEEIRQDYEKNSKNYMHPEQAKVRYIAQPVAALEKVQEVTEGEIAAYYQQNQKRYEHGEQAKARHILLRVTSGLSVEETEAIRNRLLSIRKEIEGGLAFADAAKIYSDDRGSAERGGDLGYFGRGDMVAPFDQAAFELPLGQMSEPVKTQYGFHMILVEDRKKAGTDTLDQVQNQIKEMMQKQKALRQFQKMAMDVKSLDELKDRYEINATDFFSRGDEIAGIPTRDRFAFAASAFQATPNKKVILAGNTVTENVYLVEPLERRESRPMALNDARDRVMQDVKRVKAGDLALKVAQADAARIRSASLTLEQIAAERGLTVQTAGPFGRDDTFVPGLGSKPTAIINTAFTMKNGEIAGPLESGMGHNIIRLSGREPAHLPKLDEVRDAVVSAFIQDQAERLARNEAISFADILFNKQIGLTQGVVEAKVNWASTPLFKQNDPIPGLGAKRNVNQEAFRLKKVGDISDVVEERVTSYDNRPTESPVEAFFIVELKEMKASYLPQLDEVRENVEKDLRLHLAEAVAEKQAEITLKAVQSVLSASGPLGATRAVDLSLFADAGTQKKSPGGNGGTYKGPMEINGMGQVQEIGPALPIAKTALTLAPGKISGLIKNYRMKSTKEHDRVRGPLTGVYILQVLDRAATPPDKEENSMSKQIERYMQQNLQSLVFSAWIDEVSAVAKIEYNHDFFRADEKDETAAEDIRPATPAS